MACKIDLPRNKMQSNKFMTFQTCLQKTDMPLLQTVFSQGTYDIYKICIVEVVDGHKLNFDINIYRAIHYGTIIN